MIEQDPTLPQVEREAPTSILQALGSDVLSLGSFEPTDSITYKEVQEIMSDLNDIRALPSHERSFL